MARRLVVGDIAVSFSDRAPPGGGLAPPLLLLHGAVQTRAIWLRTAARLGATRRIIAPDLRGHGATPLGTEPLTLPRLGRDAIALLDALGVGRADICGVSLGGMAALEAAALAPDRVRALALANTPRALTTNRRLRRLVERAGPQNLLPLLFRLLGRGATAETGLALASKLVGPHWVGETARRHFVAGFEAMTEGAIVSTYRAIVEADPADLSALACPLLLVDGRWESGIVRAQKREIAEALPGAVRRVVLPAGHVAPLDDPDGFARALAAFLDDLDEAAAPAGLAAIR